MGGYQCGNEKRISIDKVAGANEQKESEVRGWLMETRPRWWAKNPRELSGTAGAEKQRLHRLSCGAACRQAGAETVRGGMTARRGSRQPLPRLPYAQGNCGGSYSGRGGSRGAQNRHAPPPSCWWTVLRTAVEQPAHRAEGEAVDGWRSTSASRRVYRTWGIIRWAQREGATG